VNRYLTPKVVLALILAFSAVVRLLFFFQLSATDLVSVPILDSQTYHDWAVRLVNGDPGWGETYWMGPLYPHLLAVVYLVFGAGGAAISALQLLLSMVNILQVFFLTRLFMAETGPTQNRWTPVLAAGVFALYGAPVFYAGMILMTTLVTTLYLLIAHQALLTGKRNTPGAWFRLGLLVGLAGLARGNVLLLLVAFPLFLLKSAPNRRKNSLVFLLAGVLMLAPVTIRNLVVADDFVVLTSNGGINLLIGQKAAHKGIFDPTMDEDQADFDMSMERTLERELGKDLKGSQVSRILTLRAWDEFRGNLGAMPLHYLRKCYRFWNGYELPQIYSYDYWHGHFPALRVLVMPFLLLSALGLLGIPFLPARGRRIMILLLLTYFLSLLPFFPTSRYRIPITPLLAIGMGVFLVSVWSMGWKRQRLWLAAAGLAVALLLPRWANLSQAEVEWQVHLNEASRASKRGDLKTTLAKGRQAEEVRPGLADTPYQLAIYLDQLEAWPQAVAALQLAATRDPRNRLIPYHIGLFQDKQNLVNEALISLEQSAELDPGWASPWLRRGLILRRTGEMEQAVIALEKAYELTPGNHQVRSNLASAYATMGRYDEALALLETLVSDYPKYVNGWFNLALVHAKTGQREKATAALEKAAALRHLTENDAARIANLKQVLDQTP
jgi:tetratricopeptide (TPR) repeat protein